MNWKYVFEFIDIILITILWFILSFLDGGYAVAKYMLSLLYIRAHQNAQETPMKC
jgi:hypothetical protein